MSEQDEMVGVPRDCFDQALAALAAEVDRMVFGTALPDLDERLGADCLGAVASAGRRKPK